MSDRTVTDLAAAVVDGDQIDWEAAQGRLTSGDTQRVAECLKTLSQAFPVAPAQGIRSATRRLPWILEGARLVAVLSTVVGVIGEAIALDQTGSGRLAIILALLIVFAATALFLEQGFDRRARALAATYWTIASSFSTGGISWMARSHPHSWLTTPLLWVRSESFFPACLWQFAQVFPAVTRFSRLDRIAAFSFRVTTVAGVALIGANLVTEVGPESRLAAWARPFHRFAGTDPWFWFAIFFLALPALGAIAWRARLASTEETRRVRVFLSALVLAVAPITAIITLAALVPPFGRIVYTPAGIYAAGWFIYPPLFLLPVLTAYAVAVDNVLEVRVALRRAMGYLLARWLVAWGVGVPLVLLVAHLYRHADERLSETLARSPAPALVWTGLGSLLLLTVRQKLLRALDRWALPQMQDASTILAEATERMKHVRTPLELTSLLAEAAGRALVAPAEAFIVRDGVLLGSAMGHLAPQAQSLVPVLLEGARQPCVVSPRHRDSFYRLMSDADRKWIDIHQIAVLIPVGSGRGPRQLRGIVALGDRRNALEFSNDDLRFLQAGAAAASLACDALGADEAREAGASISEQEELAAQCGRCGIVGRWTDAAAAQCPSCGVPFELAAVPKQIAHRFDITRRLGAGGMGVVYRATDLVLAREVAIKTIPSLSERTASGLMDEARTMAGLFHPHVAVLYEVVRWQRTPLLVMEYLPGGTLAARLRRGPLGRREAIHLFRQLASALEHVHRTGQYHGDIKPSNIGFTADGTPKFLDFGLSQVVYDHARAEEHAPSGVIAGTLAYLSPEVRNGTAPGPDLDVWALCIVLWESAFGSHPFIHARTTTDMQRELERAMAHASSSPDALAQVLANALAVTAPRKPIVLREFLSELATFDDSETT